MCSSQKLCNDNGCQTCFNNSFASHEKSKYWSDKNVDENGNKITPRRVFKSSGKKYLFNCYCGHNFESSLNNIYNNKWCPYCSNKKLCDNEDCKSCHEKSFASHEKSKYWSDKNGDIKPRKVFKSSSAKYWLSCECGHDFESALSEITGHHNTWCPYCASQKLCDNEDCKSCHEKSFASHEKSKFWSDKNGDIKPREVFKSAKNKYWFICECGHQFESSLNSIGGIIATWCPYCANKKLCDNEDCKSCHEKSFASHEKSKYWSDKNGDIKPRKVFKSSSAKYWLSCECGHDFESALSEITGHHNTWCPYCSNPSKKLCDNEDCQSCREKSFASHEKSKYWSDKNVDENGIIINPRQVFKFSGIKYWFICECGHDFESNLNNISGLNRWCPICVNKTERKLYEHLLKIYPNIIHKFYTYWCKNTNTNSYLPFDFVLKEQKIIIELDGPQHFVQVSNWDSPEEQFENDQYKEKCANDNGYSVIRIIQEDVWNDTYDWVNELKESIEQIINEKIIQNIYLCLNNEYENFN
jgi:very-short-patch-repair endonuclease